MQQIGAGSYACQAYHAAPIYCTQWPGEKKYLTASQSALLTSRLAPSAYGAGLWQALQNLSISPEWHGLTLPEQVLILSREAGKQPFTEPCPHLHAIMPRHKTSVKKLGLVAMQLNVESARLSGGASFAEVVAFDPVGDR